jgi:hypothetical protein
MRSWLIFILSMCGASPLAAFRGGAPLRSTSAPGDSTCNQCHGRALNSGGGSLRIEPLARTYEPGKPLRIRVVLSDPRARAWGFHLTARMGAEDQTVAGRLEPVPGDASTQSLSRGETITHTFEGAGERPSPQATWEVLWIPPADAPEFVTFYVSGNAANGDGDNWGDDQIYTASRRLALEGSVEARQWLLEAEPAGEGGRRRIRAWNEGNRAVQISLDGELRELRPWQAVEWAWSGPARWIDVELPEGVRMEAVVESEEKGRTVGRARLKPSGAQTAVVEEGCRGEIVNLSSAAERFTVTRRESGGELAGEDEVTVEARTEMALPAGPGLVRVRPMRADAPFAFHERCSVEK